MPDCKLCGHPMPPGEEMFYYHGYSSDCPAPPIPKEVRPDPLVERIEAAIKLASKLGADAFDLIEGRGLHQDRLAIQAEVEALRRKS